MFGFFKRSFAMMKSIAVLGSTGSIGKSTLAVARHLADSVKVSALAAHSNIELLKEQIKEFHPKVVAVFDKEKAKELKKMSLGVQVLEGAEGIEEVSCHPSVDFVIVAMLGISALGPTLRAIEQGKGIGIANKEILVSAGKLLTTLAKRHHVPLIPIDSEHSAIFQCLLGKKSHEVKRIILTASGGPFRSYSREQLSKVTLDEALLHPTWKMGPKITIDSSTLMNKGLEMIEAHYLFEFPPEQIEVVIHPQSIIHSMVEFIDGSVFAEMSEPSMTYPIQYALTFPHRKPGMFPSFDFIKNARLEFYPPDFKKFPCLQLAYEALKQGHSMPGFLNSANQVLVERCLKKEISWQGIPQKLELLLTQHQTVPIESMETVFSVDRLAKELAVRA